MKIVNSNPPNIKRIIEKFGITGKETIVFTYGNIMYNPNRGYIDFPLRMHEETHQKQQGQNPEAWWDKYLEDDKFRLEQELEAYRVQYRYFQMTHSKVETEGFLYRIAKDLSGIMYGNVVTFSQAKDLITK